MKIYLSIVVCLLISCSKSKENAEKNILSEAVFTTILKQIHLEKASAELHKNITPIETKLSKSYIDIYHQNETTEEEFVTTLDYYTNNASLLEGIYDDILEQLINEKSKLDQQETN